MVTPMSPAIGLDIGMTIGSVKRITKGMAMQTSMRTDIVMLIGSEMWTSMRLLMRMKLRLAVRSCLVLAMRLSLGMSMRATVGIG